MAIRRLTYAERTKRGCIYCTDVGTVYDKGSGAMRRVCPHMECPYKALDKYDSYEDFLKSEDSEINIGALLDADWSGGKVTPGAKTYFPILRRFGKDGLF